MNHSAMSIILDSLDKSESGKHIFQRHEVDYGQSDQLYSANYMQFANKPVTARYAALAAMDKSSRALSFSELAALWHLRSADHAKQLAHMFAKVGLGRISCGNSFILRDSQYMFCSAAARTLNVNGHLLLLSGCMPSLGEKNEWSSFCFSNDQVAIVSHSWILPLTL